MSQRFAASASSPSRRRLLLACLAAVISLQASGCNLLIPLAILGEKPETVPAEFDKLEGKRVAIVVWAAPETLFDYPHVRLELALHITDRMSAAIEDIKIVDARLIESKQEESLSTSSDPVKLGKQYKADMVVYIELLEFQIRDPNAPDLLRATLRGSASVYDLTTKDEEPKRYELKEVSTTYPDSGSMLLSTTNAMVVRKTAYEQFADAVARKFYEHKVERKR